MATTSQREQPRFRPPATMSREDIRNVEPIAPDELPGLLSPLSAISQPDSDLLDDLDRWTLTLEGVTCQG